MSQVIPSADEPIRNFVRSRLDVPVPPSLTTDVMRAVMDTVDTRTSRFSPLFAGISAAVAVALLFATALWVSGPRNIGPDPAPSPSPQPTATPAPTLTPEAQRSLLHPGDVVRLPAQDAEGEYGVITLTRGEEVSHYDGDHTPLVYDSFFIEVHVSYQMYRATPTAYGADDWSFRAHSDGTIEDAWTENYFFVEFDGETVPALLPDRSDGDEPIEGWLVIAIPEDAATLPISLFYMDRTVEMSVGDEARTFAEIPLREPGDPIGVSPAWTMPPGMSPPPMAAASPHADAQALFEETDSCESAAGYRLSFPASWYTNPATDELPACSWFAPEPFDIGSPDDPPAEVVIVIERRIGNPVPAEAMEWIFGTGGAVGGIATSLATELRAIAENDVLPVGERILYYLVSLDGLHPVEDPSAEWIYAGTTTLTAESDQEFGLHKQVLHRIMASMEVTDR